MSGHHHQDLMHDFHFHLTKFWWSEIKLASQKIIDMEEGSLVYNDVVDIKLKNPEESEVSKMARKLMTMHSKLFPITTELYCGALVQ